MANQAITGRFGDVKKDSVQLCHTTAWALNYFNEFVAYNSNCTGGNREKVPTFKDWNGTFQLATEDGKAPSFDVGTYFDIALNTSTVAGKGVTYTGNVLITALPVQVTIDGASDLVIWSVGFEGNGLLTITDNP